MIPATWCYRHDEVEIPRPYAFDVTPDGWLWEGTTRNRLLGHHLGTAEFRVLTIPEMENQVVYSVFAWQGKLLLEFGGAKFYLVYDLATGRALRRPLPDAQAITWYGTKLPGDRLLLFERTGRALLLDAPEADYRIVPCPYAGDLGGGSVLSDGLVYIFLADPARLVRFDPARARFLDETPLPWPEVAITGRGEHRGVLYCGDSSHGRIFALDLATGRWREPIPTPDHGKVYGFIGGGFQFGDQFFFCLSTYAHRSRLDTKTGKIIIPEGPLTVDGKPPRFLERMLVFSPDSGEFDYLVAPPQPDGVPLLCYNWSDGERFVITGMVIPFGAPGEPDMTRDAGSWLVMQSQPAAAPPFGPFDFAFDRESFLRQRRRAYPAARSLYLPELPHCPPPVNFSGPATQYPPGRNAELLRRAARTDAKAYWEQVAARLCPSGTEDAQKAANILGHVKFHLYYNPIQEPQQADPIAAHEAHEARCGSAMNIVLRLCAAAGLEARAVSLHHHCAAEIAYGGAWHAADPLFFGRRQPSRDGRVLSYDELKADPYYADAYPQDGLAYDPELLLSTDGFQVLGYVFGPWGSEPYYSAYLGAPWEQPPTLPTVLPARREGKRAVRLHWAKAVKLGGGRVEYDVRVLADRACTQVVWQRVTPATSLRFPVPEANRMYFVEVRALDDHRQQNPNTWYPAARANFMLVPPDQYGWYGVL